MKEGPDGVGNWDSARLGFWVGAEKGCNLRDQRGPAIPTLPGGICPTLFSGS